MTARPILHRYEDPVDLIWLRAAAELGLTIERSPDAFAAYDGLGKLTIADDADLDPDDSLAQMIFHEICHWLVAGKRGNELADWGLENIDDQDLVLEYATHRVQAALAQPYGLRDFMAVTTDWRPYWNQLPMDPLRDGDDTAIPIAQNAFRLAQRPPFEPVLTRSLSATAAIADAIRPFTDASSIWSITRPRHRLGSLMNAAADRRCGTCVWTIRDEAELQCRQHKEEGKSGPVVRPEEVACERWEAVFSEDECGSCGACCHRGFDLLTVADDDPFKRIHPDLVQLRDDGDYCVPRPNGHCVALEGTGTSKSPYRCRHYASRPKNCAEFEVAGDACMLARRRVGLSR
ncbi:MAG: YkgJ family cysteine cluster protein [Planctomycetota bacterium]